MIKTSQF